MCVSLKRTENTMKLLGKLHAHFSRQSGLKSISYFGCYPSQKPAYMELRSTKNQPVVAGHLRTKRPVIRRRENWHAMQFNCRYKKLYFNARCLQLVDVVSYSYIILYRHYGGDLLRAGRSGDLNPVGGEIFRIRPERPWGPPSLLHSGYRVFAGDKAAGACLWSPNPI